MTFQKDGILRRHRPEIKIKKGMLFETIYDILGNRLHNPCKFVILLYYRGTSMQTQKPILYIVIPRYNEEEVQPIMAPLFRGGKVCPEHQIEYADCNV